MHIGISVIIPTKNRASTLIECVNSVLEQTYGPDEVIVVDDHSDDDTKNLISSHSDVRLKYVALIEESGAQAARNMGLKMAHSDWIAFQDSDDLWLPDKLERQVAVIESEGRDQCLVIHGDAIKKNITTGVEERITLPFTNGNCYNDLLIKPAPFLQAMLAPRRLLMKLGGLDPLCPSHQEWDLSIRLAKNSRFIHIREPLFIWQRHEFETISADPEKGVAGYDYVIEKYKKEITMTHGYRKWRQLKLLNTLNALKNGCYEQAKALIRNQGIGLTVSLTNFFILIKVYPRGLGRLIVLLT
ncbi:glycosyltransferase family 2 protein [Polynucleobacter sp. AP-Kaivos-20-H2]|uniref:glycosyltransferase family 2 protein n=1 Tax=Polynucleobacter sp. AP-Kaivos-20-H2 TaxID=2689104 RepID=UPI001C0BC6C5|nr:glycosyltransferase family 2 protein [Polynucleobacter sp. AP-Kaivos-20-H2]MBU3604126.1 glycosyltransferase family 2 protein [Polynucleobacter sp. AP-Kaivos-20-H2]